MNLITSLLATETLKRCGITAPASHRVYIDNVLAVGVEGQVSSFREHFLNLCRDCNVTLNVEECNVPTQQLTFCGQHLDLVKSTVSLPEKTITKLQRVFKFVHDSQGRMTMRDFAAVMGTLTWASRVLRIPCGDYYTVMKCYRRRCSSVGSMNEPTSIWACSLPTLHQWFRDVLDCGPVPIGSAPEVIPTLYTDACEDGYGAVLYDGGQVHVFSQRWTQAERRRLTIIAEMEAAAVRLAIAHFTPQLAGRQIELVIDNTSVQGAIHRGMSRNYEINETVRQVYPIVRSARYVQSHRNPSDNPSRDRPLDHALLTSELQNHGPPTAVGWLGKKGSR
jgi:hypothetical protein